MSKQLIELLDTYGKILEAVLNLNNPGELLLNTLTDIEDTQLMIDKGLLR